MSNYQKNIQVVDNDGFPLADAYVIPEHGDETYTDFDGKATAKANSKDENIQISTVSGESVSYLFEALPGVVKIKPNSLSPVEIYTEKDEGKKEKNALWWALGGIAALFLFSDNDPKKVTL